MTLDAAPLEVGGRRGPSRWVVPTASLLALLGVLAWYAAHPPALDTSGETRRASTPVGAPVYVGMYAAPPGRTIEVDGVKVHATASTEAELAPLVCKGGSLAVTSDPAAFCRDLVAAAGSRLEPGDSVVVEVAATDPTIVVVDRLRIGYRDGVRAATQPAGAASAVVTVLGR